MTDREPWVQQMFLNAYVLWTKRELFASQSFSRDHSLTISKFATLVQGKYNKQTNKSNARKHPHSQVIRSHGSGDWFIKQNLRSKYFLAVDGWKFKDSSKFHRNSGKDPWSPSTNITSGICGNLEFPRFSLGQSLDLMLLPTGKPFSFSESNVWNV